MRDARTEIADTTNGRTTWGSYQHYGSPYFQFFYPKDSEEPRPTPPAAKALAGKAGGKAGAAVEAVFEAHDEAAPPFTLVQWRRTV